MASETGAIALEHMPINRVGQQIARNVSAVELCWKSAALINDSAIRDMTAFETFVRNVVEVTEGVGIMQRAVFAEPFDVVSALHLMQPDLFAEIRPCNDIAVFVEIESPRVSAAFREQFELTRDGMITPDALLKFGSANARRYCAALRAVKPAVRPPRQRIRDCMSVLQTESADQHLGIAVGNVVMIAVGIKKQIGRLNNKYAVVTNRHS